MERSFIALALIGSLLSGCCLPERRTESPYPSKVSGWLSEPERLKFHEEHGFWARGDFVLRKNESADDGKLKVKVIELIPPDPCAEGGSFLRQARVTLQFIRMSDQKMLCEETFPERGYLTVYSKCGNSLSEFEIPGVGVTDINLKEGWAFIRL